MICRGINFCKAPRIGEMVKEIDHRPFNTAKPIAQCRHFFDSQYADFKCRSA